MNKNSVCTPVSIGCGDKINNITFDGCNYYCTINCKHEIIRLDSCYKIEHRYSVCREYDCICYDFSEHCFWASSNECAGTLFRLDCKMNETESFSINQSDFSESDKNTTEENTEFLITGISCNCCNNTLIISSNRRIIEFDIKCHKSKLLYCSKKECIIDVLKIGNNYITIAIRGQQYFLDLYDECFNRRLSCFCFYSRTVPKTLIFNPCKLNSDNDSCDNGFVPYLEIFILKKCQSPCICSYNLPDEFSKIEPCGCNNLCNENCCDKIHGNCNPCMDVIESIALIETAIAHILNAEGEKIQKVLAETDDIDKIVCVNNNVNKTIVNVTQLEQVLYSKLNLICDFNNGNSCCGEGHLCSDN